MFVSRTFGSPGGFGGRPEGTFVFTLGTAVVFADGAALGAALGVALGEGCAGAVTAAAAAEEFAVAESGAMSADAALGSHPQASKSAKLTRSCRRPSD